MKINRRFRLIILVVIVPFFFLAFTVWPNLIAPLDKSFQFIAGYDKLYGILIGVGVAYGILHLLLSSKGKVAREHMLYRKLGPIGSSPLTGLTHGIFIHGGIKIIYIFIYDKQTILTYQSIDKTTVTISMLAIITYSVYSLYLMCLDIINSKLEDKFGYIIKDE